MAQASLSTDSRKVRSTTCGLLSKRRVRHRAWIGVLHYAPMRLEYLTIRPVPWVFYRPSSSSWICSLKLTASVWNLSINESIPVHCQSISWV